MAHNNHNNQLMTFQQCDIGDSVIYILVLIEAGAIEADVRLMKWLGTKRKRRHPMRDEDYKFAMGPDGKPRDVACPCRRRDRTEVIDRDGRERWKLFLSNLFRNRLY
jgi:hypothetical protein